MDRLVIVLRSCLSPQGASPVRAGVRLGLALTLLVGLSSPASACPACSLGQALSTLVYVAAFMTIPYVIVTGVCMWMRRVVRTEEGGDSSPPL
jgi:hypothetical protein